jgi:hypothetical protein
METRTIPNIDEIPVVSGRGSKDIDDVVVEIIKADLHDSDGIMQSCEDHLTMMMVQHKLGGFMQHNFSIDKDKLMSVRLRCREVLTVLDLIAAASDKIRYKHDIQ